MTENLPAVVQPREVATTDTDSWIPIVANVGHLAELIASTEFVPKQLRNSAPAVAAAILYGREVGLPPMTALTQTHVIEGRPSMSAEAMRALVFAAGHELAFEEATGAQCIIRARRAGSQEWTRLGWSIDQARVAGLLGKSNWKSYPRAMLVARCTADICRMVFPDVIHGFRAVEEFDDGFDVNAPAAEGAASTTTTKVSRTRKAAAVKKAAAPPALEQAPAERARPSGPPLPGEDGYEEQPARAAAPEQAGEVTEEPSSSEAEPGEADTAPAVEDPEPQPEESPEESEQRSPRLISKPQLRMLMGLLNKLGLTGEDHRDQRLAIVGDLAGHPVDSTSDLTSVEASRVIDTLARVKDLEGLIEVLEAAAQERGGS